jgi:hypothetical protein
MAGLHTAVRTQSARRPPLTAERFAFSLPYAPLTAQNGVAETANAVGMVSR